MEKIEEKDEDDDEDEEVEDRRYFFDEEKFNELEEEEKEVAKHGLLPSISESKIWKVKCKIGCEDNLVMQILRKAIDYLNREQPFLILTAFSSELSKGCIFIEAHKLSHV
jgi:hypothetical protein